MVRVLALSLLAVMLAACSENKPKPVKADWLSMDDPATRDWPANLSDWQLFKIADKQLQPGMDVEPYQLNTPLFSDYALKFRTLWLPANTQFELGADKLSFPVGSVLTKTFYYASDKPSAQPVKARYSGRTDRESVPLDSTRLIETRLLIHTDYGWVGLPYIWNAEQTDAQLEIAGGRVPVELTTPGQGEQAFSYSIPNMLECAGCHVTNHSNKALLPIGPTLANLNIEDPALGGDQLDRFKQRGWLPAAFEPTEQLTRWDDQAATLESRAKAYLQVNCAHCHNDVGAADTSGLYLNKENPVGLSYGLCKPPVAAGKGSGGHIYDIVPGAPGKSILSYRLHSTDPGEMMPEVGRTLTHREGVLLIDQWITSLDGFCSDPIVSVKG